MKIPLFFLKRGHWGQYGWSRVSWYIWLIKQFEHTNKIKWVKPKCRLL